MARKATPRKPLAVSEMVVRRARAGRKSDPILSLGGAFKSYQPPPGVVPNGETAPTLAMDWAPKDLGGLAGIPGISAFLEGQVFPGYSYLAMLAQRPEYRLAPDAIADDMVRKWIKIEVSGDEKKDELVAQITAEMARLNVREVFRQALLHDGLYGMGHIYFQIGDAPSDAEVKTPIGSGADAASRVKVKKGSFKALRNVEPVWTTPSRYNTTDPLSPDWYRPSSWYVFGREIDATRLATIVGREVPDILKPAYNFGGLSLSQMMKPYVDNWLETRQNVNAAIRVFSTSVLMTNMDAALSGQDDASLNGRVQLFSAYRDSQGVLAIDKDGEDFKEVSKPLGTLDALQAQAQEHLSLPSRIPLVKLLGIQPSGLNASADGEMEVWRDLILAFQESRLRAPLTKVLSLIQLNLVGEVDPGIGFSFVPLEEMSLKERAEIRLANAQADQTYVDMGAIGAEQVRQVLASDPNSPFAGLEDRPEDGDDTDDMVREALSDILDGESPVDGSGAAE